MTWADFRREYYRQYFTDRYQDQKRREFAELKQGSMSVADYEAAFIDLSRFAYVANEREKCRLFQDGLKLPNTGQDQDATVLPRWLPKRGVNWVFLWNLILT